MQRALWGCLLLSISGTPIGNAVHLRIFCLFYVQNEISQIAKNPAIARFFNYQKPLSIRISGLSERH